MEGGLGPCVIALKQIRVHRNAGLMIFEEVEEGARFTSASWMLLCAPAGRGVCEEEGYVGGVCVRRKGMWERCM